MGILEAIIGFLKTIPILDKWMDRAFDAWGKHKVKTIERRSQQVKEDLNVVTTRISNAKDNETRRALLRDLSKLQ